MIRKTWDKITELLDNILIPENPWAGYDPGAETKPDATHDDMAKAVTDMGNLPVRKLVSGLTIYRVVVFVWLIAHIVVLYTMAGSEMATGILFMIGGNMVFILHYLVLLAKGTKHVES